jgi:hypothetical protein
MIIQRCIQQLQIAPATILSRPLARAARFAATGAAACHGTPIRANSGPPWCREPDGTAGSGSSRALPLLAAFALMLATTGCSLFETPSERDATTTRKLPPLRPPPGSITLDVVYVERPLDDALMGELLWRRVDQIQSLEPETRAALSNNGFRVGVAGSNPPRALQQMLGLKSDFKYEPTAEQLKQLQGHRFFVPPEGEIRVVASPVQATCEFSVERGGQLQRLTFENAQCQFKVTAEHIQPGWVRLEFLPQVAYGREYLRRTADESGWRFETAPRVQTFLQQRFSLSLAQGEMALITAAPGAQQNLGSRFFLGAADEASEDQAESAPQIQRLLVVRLAGTHDAEIDAAD